MSTAIFLLICVVAAVLRLWAGFALASAEREDPKFRALWRNPRGL